MDLTSLIAIGGTWVLSIAAVGVFLAKFLPKTAKYVRIAKEALDIADELIVALQDKQITEDEIRLIIKDVEELKAALKA